MQHIILPLKFLTKKEIHQIILNYSPDIDFKDFMKLFQEYTKESYSFLVNDTRFRKNIL